MIKKARAVRDKANAAFEELRIRETMTTTEETLARARDAVDKARVALDKATAHFAATSDAYTKVFETYYGLRARRRGDRP